MSDKPENPPAFPNVYEASKQVGVGFITKDYTGGGMTLRDYFAARALQGFIAHGKKPYAQTDEDKEKTVAQYLSEQSYYLADAMLKARGK